MKKRPKYAPERVVLIEIIKNETTLVFSFNPTRPIKKACENDSEYCSGCFLSCFSFNADSLNASTARHLCRIDRRCFFRLEGVESNESSARYLGVLCTWPFSP